MLQVSYQSDKPTVWSVSVTETVPGDEVSGTLVLEYDDSVSDPTTPGMTNYPLPSVRFCHRPSLLVASLFAVNPPVAPPPCRSRRSNRGRASPPAARTKQSHWRRAHVSRPSRARSTPWRVSRGPAGPRSPSPANSTEDQVRRRADRESLSLSACTPETFRAEPLDPCHCRTGLARHVQWDPPWSREPTTPRLRADPGERWNVRLVRGCPGTFGFLAP